MDTKWSVDAIKGLFWGAALGDALGAPFEFRMGPSIDKYDGTLALPLKYYSRYRGCRVGVIGQVTDDTEMTLALCDSLQCNTLGLIEYDRNKAIKAYLSWANSRSVFMGRNTRALFNGIKTIKGYENRYRKLYKEKPESDWSQSNGCLMRCSVLGFVDNYKDAAAQDCAITNPHPICVDACRLYVSIVAHALRGTLPINKTALKTFLHDNAVEKKVHEVIDEAFTSFKRDVLYNGKGWVLNSLWCAIKCIIRVILHDYTYQRCIDWVIRLGGDTDTNACIAGALIGAYLGYDGLGSTENLAILEKVDVANGELDRPKNYTIAAIPNCVIKLS